MGELTMRKLHVRKIEPNRWQVWVVPEDGYEGFADSFYRINGPRHEKWYANDHNATVLKKRQDMVQYLLKNF
jgi:uncharacterized protein (DUF2225 family)